MSEASRCSCRVYKQNGGQGVKGPSDGEDRNTRKISAQDLLDYSICRGVCRMAIIGELRTLIQNRYINICLSGPPKVNVGQVMGFTTYYSGSDRPNPNSWYIQLSIRM